MDKNRKMESSSSVLLNLNESDRKYSNVFTAKKQAQDFEMNNVSVVPDGECTIKISS